MINFTAVENDGFSVISDLEIAQFVGEEPYNRVFIADNVSAEKEVYPILKRADAGLSCFTTRADVSAKICLSEYRSTEYKAPAGYHDYDKCYEIFVFSSGCWSNRVSLLYGVLPVHVTGGGAVELAYGDIYNEGVLDGYLRPVLITGRQNGEMSAYIGEDVDRTALSVVMEVFAKRVIKALPVLDDPFTTMPSLLWVGNAVAAMESESRFLQMFTDLTQ